jgi:hypothetical protein
MRKWEVDLRKTVPGKVKNPTLPSGAFWIFPVKTITPEASPNPL